MFLLNDRRRTIIESAGRLNVNQSGPRRFLGTLLFCPETPDYKSVRFYGCAFSAGDPTRMGLIKRVINYALPTTWMNAVRSDKLGNVFFLGFSLIPGRPDHEIISARDTGNSETIVSFFFLLINQREFCVKHFSSLVHLCERYMIHLSVIFLSTVVSD